MRAVRWLLLLGLSAVASAGSFDSYVEVIDARLADPTLSPRKVAALEAAKARLSEGGIVSDDARAAWRCAATLSRRFPRDAAFGAAATGAADVVATALAADRDVLASYAGTYGVETKIERGLRRAELDFARAERTLAPVPRLRRLWLAARDLRQAFPPQPDFSLVDLNDKTPTSGTEISPRDQYGVISAWYFGKAY
jgi:hypothetical protein